MGVDFFHRDVVIDEDIQMILDSIVEEEIEDNLKLMASPLVGNKSVFDFSVYA